MGGDLMKIFLLFYAVSIILCWIGIRTLYKAEEWDVEPFCIILMFMPVFNFIDKILLSSQFIGKYGWIMAIELKEPKK